jgi:transcriptional regulator with XRE-family HTH domain
MPRKLVHYLRNERRRQGLTQADVAKLLGARWKGRVSWYERGGMPPTNVALEYEAILGKPMSELLGGAFDRALFDVRRRARELLRGDTAPNTPRRWRRHQTLERIAS